MVGKQKSIGLRIYQYDYLEETRALLKKHGINDLFPKGKKPNIIYLSQGEILYMGCLLIQEKLKEAKKI